MKKLFRLNRTACSDDGAIQVFTKKRILRLYDEYNIAGLECDDKTGEWVKKKTFNCTADGDEWCAKTNTDGDNDYRMPRQIEQEKFNKLFRLVNAFMNDPSGLNIDNASANDKPEDLEAILVLWVETFTAAHKSMGIAAEKAQALLDHHIQNKPEVAE